jgi:hypothetical protein
MNQLAILFEATAMLSEKFSTLIIRASLKTTAIL